MSSKADALDICRTDAFKIRKRLLWLLPCDSQGIDLGRGDPCDPPSWRADAVISLFSIFTDHVLRCAAERLTLPADLPIQDLELLWDQAITQVDAVTCADAMAVLAEFVAVQPDSAGGHRFGQALAWVVANDNGGGYGKLHGQPELRAVAARHLLRAFTPLPGNGLPQIATHNVSFTSGANEAIGALFRLLQASGYLRPGDVVGMLEPVYSPYLDIARNKLNLRTVMLKSDAAHDWDPTEADLESFAQQVQRLNRPLKVFCLVNPNNPSSRALSGQTIDSLARLLKMFNCLVIEDTVYHEFVPASGFHSLWARLPEQTVLVHSMSKYYRVTGSRLGMVVVTDGGEEYIRQHILCLDRPLITPYGTAPERHLFHHGASNDLDDDSYFALAKGPGPAGSLSHTTHLPRPMQLHALIRLIVDHESGRAFTQTLHDRWAAFYRALNTPSPEDLARGRASDAYFVPYYVLLDLYELVAAEAPRNPHYACLRRAMERREVTPLRFFEELAECGVCVLPAATFFGDPQAHQWSFRASVANQPLPRVVAAAERLRALLDEKALECAKREHTRQTRRWIVWPFGRNRALGDAPQDPRQKLTELDPAERDTA